MTNSSFVFHLSRENPTKVKTQSGQVHDIKQVIAHPKFIADQLENNIALVMLSEAVE